MGVVDPSLEEPDPLPGRVVGGKYEIRSLLGGGAMGRVYKAHHLGLDKTIAIKVLHKVFQADAKFAARFHREALAASKLDHPNGLQVLDFGQDTDGLLYIAMEFLAGKDLHKLLVTEGLPSLPRTVDIMSQVCGALAAAHDRGIVHRDMKPENVVVVQKRDDDGTVVDLVKVCDFGIAKLQDSRAEDDGAEAAPLTTAGMVCGTPEFMSPEQAQGKKLDARSDVYSCGVILFQMATGKLPFTGDSAIGIVMKHLTEPPPRPSEVNPAVDPGLEAVILRAMEKDPQRRPQSARDLRHDLRALLHPSELGPMTGPRMAAPAPEGPTRPAAASSMRGAVSLPPPSAASKQFVEATAPTVTAPATPPRTPSLPPEAPVVITPAPSTARGIEVPPAPRAGRAGVVAGAAALVALGAAVVWIATRPDAPAAPVPPVARDPAPSAVVAPTAPVASSAPATTTLPQTPVPAVPAEPAVAPVTADGPQDVATAKRAPVRPVTKRAVEVETAPPAPAAPTPAPAPSAPAPVVAEAPRPVPAAPAPPRPAPVPSPAPVGPLEASARVTVTSSGGSLPRSAVQNAANRLKGQFERCYRTAAQQANRNASGRVSVTLVIDESGRARGVRASGDPLPGLSACVRSAATRLTSSTPPDTGTADASFDVQFSPRSR